jgi:PAS domain S-box-containing protein
MDAPEPSPRATEPVEASDPAVLLVDGAGRVVAATVQAGQALGRAAAQLRGLTLGEIFREQPHAAYRWLHELPERGEAPPPLRIALEVARADGLLLGLEGVLYAIRVGSRPEGQAVAGLMLRASQGLVVKSELLMAQRQMMESVAKGVDVRETLRSVAAFAERWMPGEIFCMITPVTADGVFEAGLCPTLPDDVARVQAGFRAGEASSPATVAAGAGDRLTAHDLVEVPAWLEFARRLQRHGLIASWVVPVRVGSDDAVRAVLEFLLPVRRLPTRSETALMDELAGMVHLAMDLHALAAELRMRSQAQRVAEDSALQRRQHLDALVDTALDAVISIDDRGLVTLWNMPAERLFGWRADETLGRPLSEFVMPPEMRQAHHEGLRRAAATGTGPLLGRRIEITAMDRVGRRFPVELSINKIPGAAGGFSAFLRDISDRRRAEAAVKTSEERLKQVIEASADGFWDLRLDGGGSMVSDRCATMLGQDPELQPLATPPEHPWLHPADRPAVQRAWQRHMDGELPRYESEHRRRAADGSWRWMLERGRVVERDTQGRVQRVVGVISDITERRTLEATLGSAERLESIGLVAGGLARQLDELLGVVRAHASLARVEGNLPSRVSESLEVIQMTVARAKALVRSVLGLSPQSSAAAPSLVSVGAVLRESLQLLRAGLPRTAELVLEDRGEGRDLVRIDPSLLQQSVMNMVLRATEAAANAGRITVRVFPVGNSAVAVRCIDAGVPLTPEAALRIGEALGDDGSLASRTALGMAAVRRFAESAGGTLYATHGPEGNLVTLELPLQESAVPVQRPVVALCEDHPLLGPMLAEALHAAGHRVLRAETSAQLLPLLRPEAAGSVAVVDEEGWKSIADTWHGACHAAGCRPGLIVLGGRVGGPTGPGFEWIAKPFAAEALLAAVGRVSSWSAALNRGGS